jgi:hypothetical protein
MKSVIYSLIILGVGIAALLFFSRRQAVENDGEVDQGEYLTQLNHENPLGHDGNPSEGAVVTSSSASVNASNNQAAEDLRKASCFPKSQLTPEELLPQDNSSTWAKVNPQGAGTLKDKNFLQAGHHVGINTVGQTLRNPNLQLRSEPPNPQVKVSPWQQTTMDPDANRRPFEIGGCA